MIDQTQISKLLEFLSLSRRVSLILPNSNNPDLILSVLAYHLFLKDLSQLNNNKHKLESVEIFTPKKISLFKKWPKLASFLLEQELLNEFKLELGKNNLIVSFPYEEEKVDKVSYHIGEESQRFYLTIKPKKGNLPLDSKKVEFNYAGAEVDLLLLFGVENLEELDQLYFGYEDLYKNNVLVTFNNFLPDFGTLNLDLSGSSAYGEAIFYCLKNLAGLFDVELSDLPNISQISTLLLSAISLKTANFAAMQMKIESFLAVAELLKLGARRLDLSTKTVNKQIKKSSVRRKKAKVTIKK